MPVKVSVYDTVGILNLPGYIGLMLVVQVQNGQSKNSDKLPLCSYQSFRNYHGENTFILRYLSRRLDIQKVSVGVASNHHRKNF